MFGKCQQRIYLTDTVSMKFDLIIDSLVLVQGDGHAFTAASCQLSGGSRLLTKRQSASSRTFNVLESFFVLQEQPGTGGSNRLRCRLTCGCFRPPDWYALLPVTIPVRVSLQERLAVALCIELGITSKPLSQLRKSERQALLAVLTAWQLPITGHEGYKKAEVTGGGVVLEQIDCKTMESRVS